MIFEGKEGWKQQSFPLYIDVKNKQGLFELLFACSKMSKNCNKDEKIICYNTCVVEKARQNYLTDRGRADRYDKDRHR